MLLCCAYVQFQTYRLDVDGAVRSFVTEKLSTEEITTRDNLGVNALSKEWKICSVEEYVGGDLQLVPLGAECSWTNEVDKHVDNPLLELPADLLPSEATHVHLVTDATFSKIQTGTRIDEAVQLESINSCSFPSVSTNTTIFPIVGLQSSQAAETYFYIYDSRLQLIDNTPAHPGPADEVCSED